jgi:conjugal transfer/type IV secretion protein DotA/TraY
MKRFKFLFLYLPLLFISTSVFADNEFDPSELNHNFGFVYRLMHLLFGDWLNSYGGSTDNNAGVSYTILSNLGYWSCIAGLILMSILIFSCLLNSYRWSTDTKKFMGMDITTYVKALIVIVMITPAGMMGISLSQRVGVMKVVLLGDSFANMVYDNTIGKMLTPPKLDSGSINATTLASNILQAQACAWAVQNHSNSSNIDLSKVYKDGKIQPAYAQDYIVSTTDKYNSEVGRYKSMSVPNEDMSNIQNIIFAPAYSSVGSGVIATNSICGTINFPEAKNGQSVFSNISQHQTDLLKKATITLVNELAPASQALYQISHDGLKMSTNKKGDTITSQISQIYNQAVSHYISTVQNIPNSINTDINNDQLVRFIKSSGWGLGVIWWQILANAQSAFTQNTANFSNSASVKTMPPCSKEGFYAVFGQKYCVSKQDYDTLLANINTVTDINSAHVANDPSISSSDPTAHFKQICSKTGCSYSSVDNWIGNNIMSLLLKSTGSDIYTSSLNNSSINNITNNINQKSIFNVSSSLGVNLSHYSVGLWGLSAFTSGIAGALSGGSKTIVGFLGLSIVTGDLSHIVAWVSNQLSIISYMLGVPAYTLLVVVPFIPIMIWGVLLLSYFIMVVEAFIAIPAGMAMWVMNDEVFLSGRVIQTVMLLTSLFLRPFLYLVGLITAYALAPIALTIWNTLFFWGTNFMATGGFMTSLFLVFVYTAGIIKFTMMCYNVSLILPDKVLQWLGSGFGAVSAFGSVADFSTGGFTPSGGSGGGGSSGGTHSVGRGMSERYSENKKDDLKNKPSLSESGGSNQDKDQIMLSWDRTIYSSYDKEE